MRYATFLSTILHFGFLFGGLIIAPFITTDEALETPVVPIQLLSEAEVADQLVVPADRKADAVEAEDPRPVRPDDGIEVASLPEPLPAPPEPEPKTEQQPEPEPAEADAPDERQATPEPPRLNPRKRRERIDDLAGLDDVLKDLEDDPDSAPASDVVDPEGKNNTDQIGFGERLTATELDLVRARMVDCYDQLSGVPDASNLVVEVKIRVERTGEIIGDPVVVNRLAIQISGNPYWQATRDRAVRAAISCAPYDYLPQDKYEQWDEMILRFTPLGVM